MVGFAIVLVLCAFQTEVQKERATGATGMPKRGLRRVLKSKKVNRHSL